MPPANPQTRAAWPVAVRNQNDLKGESGMLETVAATVRSAKGREDGQALVEYALIIGLIAIACVAALGFVGGQVQDFLSAVANQLP
jgi:pilus assembly protein Flp/PilA